ncbi:MAG TPA: hypothetical protein VG347_23230 [Verrucomicrobiae bacterium]|nr:hypothetical protein [Verrucomicrobiae bacterium]
MKTYGILGILWLILGCFDAFYNISCILPALYEPVHAGSKVFHYMWFHGCVLLLNLAVIAAGLFLTRGVFWARWFLGSVAVVSFIAALAQIGISFSSLQVMWGLFTLISAILLLKPRQDSPA